MMGWSWEECKGEWCKGGKELRPFNTVQESATMLACLAACADLRASTCFMARIMRRLAARTPPSIL